MPELCTDAMQVRVDAMRGGKLTSLRDLRSGREWLLPPNQQLGTPAGYGASFVETELSGWDEMVPTIVACRIAGPTTPVALPDHGELWSVAWETIVADEQRITMLGVGRALPYSLERTISIAQHDRLNCSYRLHNHGGSPFPILWAAHPQLVWRPGSRVELPADVAHVLDVTSWPEPRSVRWDEVLATRLDHLQDGEGHKIWTLPGQSPEWCRLRDPDNGAITLRVDPSMVPYLGIWWDAKAYARVPVMALEPSTGHYDNLAAAAAAGRVPWLQPGAELRWDLAVELTPGD